MGKSSSKLSAENLIRQSSAPSGDVGSIRSSITSLSKKNLKDYCRESNKHSTDAQLSHILDDQQLLLPFLTQVFYQEVEVSDCMQTLFRGNCLASRIMSHCFRTFGSGYLKQLLEPHIKPLTMCKTPTSSSCLLAFDQQTSTDSHTARIRLDSISSQLDQSQQNDNNHSCLKRDRRGSQKSETNLDTDALMSYEIDVSRLDANDNISINQDNLLRLTKQILDSILLSTEDFPPQLNSMCICLLRVLCTKFSDTDTCIRAIGTVVFLRFINPAIVSPYEFGIVDEQPSPRVLRGLTLVSKILQNIANNVEFSKEEHMLPFNYFVRQQFEPVRGWITDISSERNSSRRSQSSEGENGF